MQLQRLCLYYTLQTLLKQEEVVHLLDYFQRHYFYAVCCLTVLYVHPSIPFL